MLPRRTERFGEARWWKTVEVFHEQGESQQLNLFPSHMEAPAGDPQVARVLLNNVRLERPRQLGACWLGLELWKRLELDRLLAAALDDDPADVPCRDTCSSSIATKEAARRF